MTPPRASELGLIGCHACGLVCERQTPQAPCPRCGATLHRRRPDSLARSAALLLAGLILYVPANLLPVMSTTMLGAPEESTIMSGVIDFWRSGAWDIALIIFIASVVVPCTKFIAMGALLWHARQGSADGRVARARLYRGVELIGYWSMLDVLVVGMVCALVQFNVLSSAAPRIGILFFGLVVILTMLSAMQFDPRLTWDGKDGNERHSPG
ncbi:MAG: paraquat-inducible protein A [Candidatus Dactylopiibacterium sp.]|nr:paraquat-inducible protein A [Candidatus Dactylopiibacterium sp.]